MDFWGTTQHLVATKSFPLLLQVRQTIRDVTERVGHLVQNLYTDNNAWRFLGKRQKNGVQRAEGKYGVRCSVFLGLPYYDPIRFVAIDTKHNLFLGTGKQWVECGILTPHHYYDR